MTELMMLGFTALGAVIFALGVLAGCVLAWRFRGNEGPLLQSTPRGAKLSEMPEHTE